MGSILFLVCAFSMWIYTTLAVTQHIYGTTLHLRRITGANQVGEMFANYNLIAAPLFLPLLAKYTSRFTHFIAYAVDLVLYPSISYRNQQPSLWNGFQ
jgi:hypothetical protein